MIDAVEMDRLKKISENHSYGDGFNGRLAKYRALQISELCKKRDSLLDLGAGEGLLTRLLAEKFESIEIVESSPVYMEKAKKMLSGCPVIFHNTLIEEFDTEDRFDLVLASGVLEHVKDPQVLLKKIKKWLKKDGSFVALVPNATSFHRRIGMEMGLLTDYYQLGEQDFRVGHRRYYDMTRLRDEIRQAELKVIRSGGILFKILPNDRMEALGEDYCDALYEIGKEYPELCAEIFVECGQC